MGTEGTCGSNEPKVTAPENTMATDLKDEAAEHVDMKESEPTKPNDSFPPVDESWIKREKKLVRRLDMTLMPMVWFLYLFNYLDRNNIA